MFIYITFERILARQDLFFIYKQLRLNACLNYDMVRAKIRDKQVFRILIVGRDSAFTAINAFKGGANG